jgi:hypothetical protein
MAQGSELEKRIMCSSCGKDTFAIHRESGLEVKYRDRWILILKDTVGTILFRCRACGGITTCHFTGGSGPETQSALQ